MSYDIIPRDVGEKNSVCFVGAMLNEHDFVPQMIEHHVKCGISQFILLIMDYGLKEPQPDYYIPKEYEDIVTLIRVNNELVEKKGFHTKNKALLYNNTENLNKKKGEFCSATFVSCALNDFGYDLSLIKTEWIFSVGIDQYLSLENHDSLPEFLNDLDINCNQVWIPWSSLLYNCGFQLNDSISEIIFSDDSFTYSHIIDHQYRPTQISHFNGLVKKCDFKKLHRNSHYYITNPNPNSLIFCAGQYYNEPMDNEEIDFIKIWTIATSGFLRRGRGTDNSKMMIHTIHFHLRSFMELFVCNLNWHFCKPPSYWEQHPDDDPWRIYALFIQKYIRGESDGNLVHITRNTGNRESPQIIYRKPCEGHLSEILHHPSHVNYPLRNVKIASWTYNNKITHTYYDDIVYKNLKKYGIAKKQILDVINLNLKLRNLNSISEHVKNTSNRIWFTDNDE